MSQREEICARCGKRQPISKLTPLPWQGSLSATAEEMDKFRQWVCRRDVRCTVREVRKKGIRKFLEDI